MTLAPFNVEAESIYTPRRAKRRSHYQDDEIRSNFQCNTEARKLDGLMHKAGQNLKESVKVRRMTADK
ncbi:6-phosphofructo-2-kinase / fructose-2,6-biphosphatase 3 [Sarotherodon galilaeus]